MENDFQVDVEGISDENFLHFAVGVLGCDIEKLKISVEDNPKKPNYEQITLISINSEFDLQQNKEASLAKLPPCEATFHHHVLRASLQTYIYGKPHKKRSPLLGLL